MLRVLGEVLADLGLVLFAVSRRQVARITRTFGFALDAERHARETSEALVTSLQRQDSFRDTFLRMLGHALRNPLTAVSIAASFALAFAFGALRNARSAGASARSSSSSITETSACAGAMSVGAIAKR